MWRPASASIAILAFATATSASAADLPAPLPERTRVYIPSYVWTGFYLGGHVGGAWGDQTVTTVLDNPLLPAGAQWKSNAHGVLAGGQVGVNYQAGAWVVGVEGDLSWADADSSATIPTLVPGTSLNTTINTNFLATLAGRLGYAWNAVLLYGKGGIAWTNASYTAQILTAGAATAASTITSDDRRGWTAGGGVEFAFAGDWSGKVEYDYYDFGTKQFFFNLPGNLTNVGIRSRFHTVKGGLNYHFNWGGPVSVRY